MERQEMQEYYRGIIAQQLFRYIAYAVLLGWLSFSGLPWLYQIVTAVV